MTKRLMLTGASGLVGSRLARSLRGSGWAIRGLSRSSRPADSSRDPEAGEQRWFEWDGCAPPGDALRAATAVVHLAGEAIFGGLPTRARREAIAASRIDSTRAIVDALGALPPEERPECLLCASATGFYGDRGEDELREDAAAGDGFLADLCVAWEQAAAAAEAHGVRVVSLRIGIVMAKEGGALPLMSLPFKFGLGGRLGEGRQWVSWVHIEDLVALIEFALDPGSALRGVVNAVSPEPVRNAELTRLLAAQLNRPAFMNVPAFAVRAVLGDFATELLGSHRVLPQAAQHAGFEFRYRDLETALDEVLG